MCLRVPFPSLCILLEIMVRSKERHNAQSNEVYGNEIMLSRTSVCAGRNSVADGTNVVSQEMCFQICMRI